MKCRTPQPLATLIDYYFGELDESQTDRVEAHYFDCAECSERLQFIERLGTGVMEVVHQGLVSASVTADWLARAIAQGLRVRSYHIAPGQEVQCTAAPDDDFVALRMALPLEAPSSVDLAVTWTDLGSGATEQQRMPDVICDPSTREVVLVFGGSQIRQVPRSRWTMRALVQEPEGERQLGSYRLDHTPWDELERDS